MGSPGKQRPAYAAMESAGFDEQLQQISLIARHFHLRKTNHLTAKLGNCDRRQLQVPLVKR